MERYSIIVICFAELVKVGLYDKTKQKELEEDTWYDFIYIVDLNCAVQYFQYFQSNVLRVVCKRSSPNFTSNFKQI